LGEGVIATCQLPEQNAAQQKTEEAPAAKADLFFAYRDAISQMEVGGRGSRCGARYTAYGQVRNFKICKVDTDTKRIEVTLA
jgi:hypothetical protein